MQVGKRLGESEIKQLENKRNRFIEKINKNSSKILFDKINLLNSYINNKWQPLNIQTFKTNKPIIICLPGSGVKDQKQSNGLAKIVMDIIGVDNQVEVLSVIYSNIDSSNKDDIISDKDLKNIIESLFMPSVVDNDGKRLSIDQACKNMRKINVFSHCYGSRVVERIDEILYAKLQKLGYDQQESNKILSCIFQLCYAPYSENCRNTNFYIKSVVDNFYGQIYKNQYIDSNLKQDIIYKSIKKSGDVFCHQNSIRIILPDAKQNSLDLFLYGVSLDGDEHLISNLARDKHWQVKRFYSTNEADYASKCMAYALATSVLNSIKNVDSDCYIPLNINEMQKQCQAILMQNQKIKNSTLEL